MNPVQWITVITLASAGIEKIVELLKLLKENQPTDVTQEQLDTANATMNQAVAKWDAAVSVSSATGDNIL
ncbi:MAG: hypothetical protein PHY02_06520 [Phycisphaerae bacterium]|nr:hypothetical protein [Phycisphaerae bacterium]